jgi:hypothetical protein
MLSGVDLRGILVLAGNLAVFAFLGGEVDTDMIELFNCYVTLVVKFWGGSVPCAPLPPWFDPFMAVHNSAIVCYRKPLIIDLLEPITILACIPPSDYMFRVNLVPSKFMHL